MRNEISEKIEKKLQEYKCRRDTEMNREVNSHFQTIYFATRPVFSPIGNRHRATNLCTYCVSTLHIFPPTIAFLHMINHTFLESNNARTIVRDGDDVV